ncbi:hypothetical protein MYA08_002808 [Cronobacter sakazakii]|nr:hypothetical protein [Cronobacter sakazakii]EJC1182902.1 hypothetical protein [Cronobacter sakazakii]EJC1242600.1 hypothetical protein [Cronobacter sakazakii]EJC2074165.1 hypothetical protein [Cronobacter sakazakii]EKK7729536.1 hypothetical protein [Cronobacter sakazakii]
MNIKLTACAFLMGLYSVSVMAGDTFTGQWEGAVQNDSTLTLRLKQQGKKLTGSYCYITQRGNRIDCPAAGEENLRGTVNNDQAAVEFTSSFGGGTGQAQLSVSGDKMSWKMVQAPDKGEYYAPETYNLSKQEGAGLSETRRFTTENFNISLTNKCGNFLSSCNDMLYLGIRKRDNSVITLKGKSLLDDQGKVIGSEYNNADVKYTVQYEPLRLTVNQGNKTLVNQPGEWSK